LSILLFDNNPTIRQFDGHPTFSAGGFMNSRLYPLAAGNFAIGTGMFVTAGLLPPISADLKISVSAAGQLMTVFALAYAVLSPIAAPRRGPRRRAPGGATR
jgi:predicted MFS family arabinose efflux permease